LKDFEIMLRDRSRIVVRTVKYLLKECLQRAKDVKKCI